MGAGLTPLTTVPAMGELARISPVAAMAVFETSVGPIRVVEQFGTEEQKKRLS
jgi:alkylation response protein AidB-like acyl-CoA dehydrogenase